MLSRRRLLGTVAAVGAGLWFSAAQAATEIQFWHAMGGKLGETVQKIVDDFNKSQTDYSVVPVYKGNYTETLTQAIAAFRAKEPPHIVQVFEVGTATMMSAKGAIYPVYELMKKTGQTFDEAKFVPAVASYYTTPEGKMLFDAVQQLDPGDVLQQGTPSRRPASTRRRRRRHGPSWSTRCGRSLSRAPPPAVSRPAGSPGCSSRR